MNLYLSDFILYLKKLNFLNLSGLYTFLLLTEEKKFFFTFLIQKLKFKKITTLLELKRIGSYKINNFIFYLDLQNYFIDIVKENYKIIERLSFNNLLLFDDLCINKNLAVHFNTILSNKNQFLQKFELLEKKVSLVINVSNSFSIFLTKLNLNKINFKSYSTYTRVIVLILLKIYYQRFLKKFKFETFFLKNRFKIEVFFLLFRELKKK